MNPSPHQNKQKNLTEALEYVFACNFNRVLLDIERNNRDGHAYITMKLKALRANQRDILADAVQSDRDLSNPAALEQDGGHLLLVVTDAQFQNPEFRTYLAVWDNFIHPPHP
jgi:hypothetical protein